MDDADRNAARALVERHGYLVPEAASILVIVVADSKDVEERSRACAALRCLDPATIGDQLHVARVPRQPRPLEEAARAVAALVLALVDEPERCDRERLARLLAGVIQEARRVAARRTLHERVSA